MNSPRVSVVTPAYNEEDYLAECIESVLAQTYTNWDYTVVNNCSEDRSLEIAQRFAASDRRIRVVDNSRFLSQIDNLNWSLEQISSEAVYVKMVLADDRLFPRCLAEMVRVAEKHPRVGLVSAHRQDDREVNCDGLSGPQECFDGREVARATLTEDLFVFGSPSTVMLRADLVRARRPFFDRTALHEDTEACLEILRNHDLGYVHEVLTFTRRENESLTTTRRAFDSAHRLDRLIMAAKYGPVFLSEEEERVRRRQLEEEYYRFLGERLLYQLPEGFWDYHRQGLLSAGLRLHRPRLWRAGLRAALDELKQPRLLMRRGAKLLHRSRN